MEYHNLNNLFAKPIYSEKSSLDINKLAPCYIRQPKFEECFALEFLKILKNDEYSNLELHDLQNGISDSLDLFDKKSNIGIEVTQGINDLFREEENIWNKPLCKGESDVLIHRWKNQPTSMEIIYQRVNDKIPKYNDYKSQYPIVKDIDLFVYIVDANIIYNNTLLGIPICKQFGYSANEDLGVHGLQVMLQELNPLYRKIYFIFGNYWYYANREENYKIYNCILYPEKLNKIMNNAIILQNKLQSK